VGEGATAWTVKSLGGRLGPSELPWASLGIDVVLESTGIFKKRLVMENGEMKSDGYDGHIKAGAKKVVLSVPSEDEIDCTLVLGVNDEDLTAQTTCISNASCTTNCLAPIVKVLNEAFGIVNGFMTTVHSYTNDQVVSDVMHKDLRRARAAAQNIIPTSTGAALALPRVVKGLAAGSLDGLSLRVPSLTGSLVDLTLNVKKAGLTIEEVNTVLKAATDKPELKGILTFSEDPLVSSDIVDNPASSIIDALSTKVILTEGMPGSLVKVLSWYDNEWMYSCRCADIFKKLGGFIPGSGQTGKSSRCCLLV
jgi:glyceraldehyde-3-phosphate dehydrogenase type I